MTEKKLTKRDYFEMIKGICGDRIDIVEFCDHEIELLNKKASHPRSANATQKENEVIKNQLVEALKEVGSAVTITELQGANENMAQYSNQKLSALLRQLVNENIVVKTTDKKKSYFSVA